MNGRFAPSPTGTLHLGNLRTALLAWLFARSAGSAFLVLSEVADFVYKCTNYYDPATEAGIRFDDPEVGIAWPSEVELLYSRRDAEAPLLSEVADSLPFTV